MNAIEPKCPKCHHVKFMHNLIEWNGIDNHLNICKKNIKELGCHCTLNSQKCGTDCCDFGCHLVLWEECSCRYVFRTESLK